MNKKLILLVDGHNLLFRMFYGIPNSIKNSKGLEIKGLIGFIGSIKKLAIEFKPYSIIVIFDSETSRFNNEQIEGSYKNNRKDYNDIDENDNPFTQLPLIQKALNYLNITNLEIENDEADDYIASIIKSKNKHNRFIIVSTDTDFIQLIDNNTFMYVQRGKNSILYNEQAIKAKYGIVPKQYVDFKSLVGDKCDNIGGINGIGKITAQNILNYGSIKKFIDNNENKRIVDLLSKNMDRIIKNRKLILLNDKLDTLAVVFNELSKKLVDEKVRDIINKIGYL